MFSSKPAVVFIIGPTGSGKTELGMRLARRLRVEFVSADSMQVYRGTDIVTDKLARALRKKYPHHLLDILKPSEEFSAADFAHRSRAAIEKILKKRKIPVVIGGSGLYIDALLYGIFPGQGRDAEIRARLEQEAREKDVAVLYKRLLAVDPEAAQTLGPDNPRRLIRALEVYEACGVPISRLWKKRQGIARKYRIFLFGVRRRREELYRRIDQRVDMMIHAGLLDEARALFRKKLGKTAAGCIGLKEIRGFFDGAYGLDEAVRLIKRNSRRYAKRQMTWFRSPRFGGEAGRNHDIEWIDVESDADLDTAAERICNWVKKTEVKKGEHHAATLTEYGKSDIGDGADGA